MTSTISAAGKERHGSKAAEEGFPHHAEAVFNHRETYVPAGLRGLFGSPYVAVCAAFSTLGGLIFGYGTVFQTQSRGE